MISFFRKIRQKLLSQNRVTRYLVYALGEILLVVIGILIALQVNNWNEERKSRSREEKILVGLQNEFISAKIELNADLIARERYLRFTKALQNFHLGEGNLDVEQDSLKLFINSLNSSRFYSVGHPILNDLATSGRFELIRNDSIRIYLDNYLQEKQRYTAVEDREDNFVRNQFVPFLSDYIDLSLVSKEKISSTDFNNAITNISQKNRFGSLIQLRITRTENAKDYGIRLMATIDKVLNQVNIELNKRP